MFARWGLCDKITTDNGPQFSSDEFRQFANDYTFQHVTSSSGFPQSNGEAERAVQIAKKILVQDDPSLGLMTYRATPDAATGRSPAMMMTRREMETLLPCLQRNLYSKSHPDVRPETRDTQQLINGASISAGEHVPCQTVILLILYIYFMVIL